MVAPPSVVLADGKTIVRSVPPLVFEALVKPEQLGSWWAEDVLVEAEMGGRYEGSLPEGRVEGTITGIDAPRKLSFVWPVPREGGSIETSVVYELSPKGPETSVHLVHRSPKIIPGEWNAIWVRALESLKAYLEGAESGSA